MLLLDDQSKILDAECSLDVLEGHSCIVIESSGGASARRGITRRNPDYNKLVAVILERLARAGVRITRIILDSGKVSMLPPSERVVDLEWPYPVDLSMVERKRFRTSLGRAVAAMHRSDAASRNGNSQKRIRIFIERGIRLEELVSGSGTSIDIASVDDAAHSFTETERLRLMEARVGQGLFRTRLISAYRGMCPVTGIETPELLTASHIKPWSVCTNFERLDPANGILLSALIDRLFDKGLITFDGSGNLSPSASLGIRDRTRCNIDRAQRIFFSPSSERYLEYHRTMVFRG